MPVLQKHRKFTFYQQNKKAAVRPLLLVKYGLHTRAARVPYRFCTVFCPPAQFSLCAHALHPPAQWSQPAQPEQPPLFFRVKTASAARAATAARVMIVAAIYTAAFPAAAFFGRLGLRTSMNTKNAAIRHAMPVDTEKPPVVNSRPKW